MTTGHLRMWRRGLLWLPVFYLGSAAILWPLTAEKAVLKDLQVELTAAIQEIDSVIQRPRGVQFQPRQLQELNERLDQLEARGRIHLHVVFLLTSAAVVLCLLFIWATWQVTAGQRGRLETWARWLVILHPILSVAEAVDPSFVLQIIVQLTRVFVVIGHQLAALRIARWTGNFSIAKSLQSLFKSFESILVCCVTLVILSETFLAGWGLSAWMVLILKGIATIYLVILSCMLLRLRQNIATTV